MKAAKVLNEIPEVAESFKNGELNLTQVASAQKAFEQSEKEKHKPVSTEQKKEIIQRIKKQTHFNTQKLLAETLDLKPITDDFVKPQGNKTIQIQTQLSESQFQKLEQMKSLLSNQIPNPNLADILEVAIDFYLEKKRKLFKEPKLSVSTNKEEIKNSILITSEFDKSKEPLAVQKNWGRPQINLKIQKHCGKNFKNKRVYISIQIKRKIYQRSGGCCEYISDNGIRCNSNYKINIDHVIPLAQGGSNDFKNLRHLCWTHNQLAASNLGIGFETISSLKKSI